MSYPSQPEHWDKNKGAPKHKFKFLVEFGKNSIIAQTFTQNQYMYMIKSITRPKATVATADANDQETRTWFGNVPDPTKRLQGQVSWSPITIKFINQIARTVDKDAVGSAENYEPPDDEYPPVSGPKMAVPDLDHFFSRVMEDMDPSMFGGSAPKEFDFSNSIQYTKPQDSVAAYLSLLSPIDRIDAAKKNFSDNWNDAKTAGFTFNEPENYSTKQDTTSTLSNLNCKSSMDSFMKASCVFMKFFGDIKIYDLANNLPFLPKSVPDRNLASSTTIKNGYWSLRNPYIKGIDFGSSEYSADDFIEYSLEIGYESARYVILDYKPD